MPAIVDLSGIILNQNQTPEQPGDILTTSVAPVPDLLPAPGLLPSVTLFPGGGGESDLSGLLPSVSLLPSADLFPGATGETASLVYPSAMLFSSPSLFPSESGATSFTPYPSSALFSSPSLFPGVSGAASSTLYPDPTLYSSSALFPGVGGGTSSTLYPSTTLFPSSDLFPGEGSTPVPVTGYYQTFQLPADLARGDNIPPLTGFQLCGSISSNTTATLTWQLDQLVAGSWSTLSAGSTVGTAQIDQTWFTVLFPTPVPLDTTWATNTFRILVMASEGFTGIYYSAPNPLSTGQVYDNTGTAVLDDGRTISMLFRILADVADSGTDFLGNVYRSVVVRSLADNASIIGNLDTYWLSSPNPSSFGVEALYLDMRQDGDPAVMDRMTIDPITPGVCAHVYYSNDPAGPGVDTESWDNLLWTPAYLPIQMTRKTTYAFPQPLTANYIKVEFTNLQARSYDPGTFQVPSSFRKFPQWVLDFFSGQFASLAPDLLSSGVDITYDALDLAFSYYQADLLQSPDAPALAQPSALTQTQLFQNADATDQIDIQTLSQISLAFQPFVAPPALQGDPSTVLGAYAASVATNNYSTETIAPAAGDTTVVSNLQREAVMVEKSFPVMFFFIPCRHTYRISQAMFESNVGYFAGVQQLAFHRDIYTGPVDQSQYNETLGDGANVQINDWAVPV